MFGKKKEKKEKFFVGVKNSVHDRLFGPGTVEEFEAKVQKAREARTAEEQSGEGVYIETIHVGYGSGAVLSGTDDILYFPNYHELRCWIHNCLIANTYYGNYSASFPRLLLPFRVEFVDGNHILRIRKVYNEKQQIVFNDEERLATAEIKRFFQSLP